MYQKHLFESYEIREMNVEELWPLVDKYSPGIFQDNSLVFGWSQNISEQEKESLRKLNGNMGTPLRIGLGLFHGSDFIGWSYGDQQSAETYYMRNSAVLPGHRRKGLYSALLEAKLEKLKSLGFQKIYSRHTITNNAVIIPKLKAGFVISNFELDDKFGTLVHLTYYTNPLRRKILDFRTGDLNPDEEIKAVFPGLR